MSTSSGDSHDLESPGRKGSRKIRKEATFYINVYYYLFQYMWYRNNCLDILLSIEFSGFGISRNFSSAWGKKLSQVSAGFYK